LFPLIDGRYLLLVKKRANFDVPKGICCADATGTKYNMAIISDLMFLGCSL
jgi:hypothetical protein